MISAWILLTSKLLVTGFMKRQQSYDLKFPFEVDAKDDMVMLRQEGWLTGCGWKGFQDPGQ